MTRYRRLGRIRKRYLRQLRIQIEPRLRVERAQYLEQRRARRGRTPLEQFEHLRSSRATPGQSSGAAAARQAGPPHGSGGLDSHRDGVSAGAGEPRP